jgi:hypothetical protein
MVVGISSTDPEPWLPAPGSRLPALTILEPAAPPSIATRFSSAEQLRRRLPSLAQLEPHLSWNLPRTQPPRPRTRRAVGTVLPEGLGERAGSWHGSGTYALDTPLSLFTSLLFSPFSPFLSGPDGPAGTHRRPWDLGPRDLDASCSLLTAHPEFTFTSHAPACLLIPSVASGPPPSDTGAPSKRHSCRFTEEEGAAHGESCIPAESNMLKADRRLSTQLSSQRPLPALCPQMIMLRKLTRWQLAAGRVPLSTLAGEQWDHTTMRAELSTMHAPPDDPAA